MHAGLGQMASRSQGSFPGPGRATGTCSGPGGRPTCTHIQGPAQRQDSRGPARGQLCSRAGSGVRTGNASVGATRRERRAPRLLPGASRLSAVQSVRGLASWPEVSLAQINENTILVEAPGARRAPARCAQGRERAGRRGPGHAGLLVSGLECRQGGERHFGRSLVRTKCTPHPALMLKRHRDPENLALWTRPGRNGRAGDTRNAAGKHSASGGPRWPGGRKVHVSGKSTAQV